MTTEYQKFPIQPLDAGEAFTEALNTRTDLGELYRQNEAKQIIEGSPTSTLATLKSEQAKLAAKQADLDMRQAAEVSLIRDWNHRFDVLQRAKERLDFGLVQFSQFNGAVESRLEFISQSAWGVGDNVTIVHPLRIMELYSHVMAAERAIQSFPAWRAARESEIAALESDLSAFAKKHGINPGTSGK